ncbi:hypothetical protein [Georgenia alba]|uniref:ESX-1 secretion-associated protein n=1 Tax=Georgenia alba TaxID=2233858 RepID=A0ABW2Q3D5_9MICO
MEVDTMNTFGQTSERQTDDLGTLVRNFFAATEPAEGQLSGPQKARLDEFKLRLDDTISALHRGSGVLVQTAADLNQTLHTFVNESAETYRSAQGSSNFEAATTKLAPGGSTSV